MEKWRHISNGVCTTIGSGIRASGTYLEAKTPAGKRREGKEDIYQRLLLQPLQTSIPLFRVFATPIYLFTIGYSMLNPMREEDDATLKGDRGCDKEGKNEKDRKIEWGARLPCRNLR